MRTVKEVSDIAGISVRTLHYYDEIDLLRPTEKTEAGYRLYDDKALETLQQILFFREFDISLKEIKAVMKNPSLDRNQILQMQRMMLTTKMERIQRLIASIDDILKGENKMDFEVFGKTELEEMWNAMTANMNAEQQTVFVEYYGSIDEWRHHFLENALTEKVQKNFQKVVEWYGSKEKMVNAVQSSGAGEEFFLAYQKRIENILKKIAGKKEQDVHSFEVKELIGEYDFVARQMYQTEDVSVLMKQMADAYQNNREIQTAQDAVYGDGATAYMGKAIEAFYS